MEYIATTAQMKELDRRAIEEWAIPSLELMENAASNVAEQVRAFVRDFEYFPMKVAVLCGSGNNGGDGIAAARLLQSANCEVRVFLVGNREKMTPDALANEKRLSEANLVLEDFSENDRTIFEWMMSCDCVIDALFGIGLKRPVEGKYLTAVQWINQCACPVVSCDIPSGVDGDTGEILGDAVYADLTVTFSCGKPGLYQGKGAVCAGQIVIADIGIPELLMREFL